MLEVCIRERRWEGASVVCPLPGNRNSLCLGLSKCLVEFSELKTQAKGALCEEIRPRNTEHLVQSQSSEENYRNGALISVSSPWGLAHGF